MTPARFYTAPSDDGLTEHYVLLPYCLCEWEEKYKGELLSAAGEDLVVLW
jgi:hypothetical protein